ncbi:hypothetical protein CCUS01_13193 [Colletotrichum cuscutae]|uniref:Uncharacterized protein n=1 Tax=Colletotrichum cuscutae TaxID=1209917 RepID=A0AAJ0DPA3_9PEZI|nr:hypothetical protein CCUS01_13193 [Colletotrichum cuscutae]
MTLQGPPKKDASRSGFLKDIGLSERSSLEKRAKAAQTSVGDGPTDPQRFEMLALFGPDAEYSAYPQFTGGKTSNDTPRTSARGSTAVGINPWRKLWCAIDKPEHPEPEKHQTVFFVQEHDCQYIGVRPSGVYSNVEQKQSSESISESLASEQLADVPKNISSSPISKTLTWFTNKEDQRSTATGTSWFGKAPWHRKDSNDTISSATSSVRDFLAGKTPPVTPDPEGFLSRQQDSTLTPYPAGEATRVRTPPTHEDTADGKPRGFFTDMVPPGEDSDTWDAAQPARSTSVKRNQTRCDDNLPKRPKEWWEAKQRIQPKRRLTGPRNFEFDLPEHLPSSPMCPANPKHVSGGTGVCVYHGRGRKESTLKIEHKMSDRRQGSEVSITSETDERSIWD